MAIGGLLLTQNGKPLNTSMSIQRDGLKTGRRDNSNEAKRPQIRSQVNEQNPALYSKEQNVYFGPMKMEKTPKKDSSLDRS